MLPRPAVTRAFVPRSVWVVALGAVSVVVVGIHNVLVLVGMSELETLLVNGALSVGLITLARRGGLRGRDLGLRITRRGWRTAAPAAGATAALVVVAAVVGMVPASREIAALSPGQVAFRALLAIPIGTALCEEIVFRGVFLAGWDRVVGSRWSTVLVSALFGAWHIGAEIVRTGLFGAGVVPGVVATAVVSAAVLCPLRRWSGDLAASITVHAVANVGVLLAVVLVSRPA